MDKSYGICLLVIIMRTALSASEHTHIQENRKERRVPGGILVYSPRDRTKRVAKILGFAIAEGIKATERLLIGAKKIHSDNPFHQKYEKHGGYQRALNDFESVGPSNVEYYKKPNKIFGKVGFVGDKTIMLEGTVWRGTVVDPVMKIFKSQEAFNPYADYDIIEYIKKRH